MRIVGRPQRRKSVGGETGPFRVVLPPKKPTPGRTLAGLVSILHLDVQLLET